MSSQTPKSSDLPPLPRFIEIGVNLTDPVFRGIHRGSRKHPDDMAEMLQRSRRAGVKSMIITGGSLSESRAALKLAGEYGLFATVGCHPTRSAEFDKYKGGPAAYLAALDALIAEHIAPEAQPAGSAPKGRVVAIGECGLDYDRIHFASKETQKTHFRSQLALAKKYRLPLFLHSRAAHEDFVSILKEEGFGVQGDGEERVGAGGVVHSHTGPMEDMEELVAMGFYISINGCGLKTEDNVRVAAAVPLDNLMLETDAPWCSMTGTHASRAHLSTLPPALSSLYFPPSCKPDRWAEGMVVKGRNESCAIGGVAWVIAKEKQEKFSVVCDKAWVNTLECFKLDEKDLEERFQEAEGREKTRKEGNKVEVKDFDIKSEEWPTL